MTRWPARKRPEAPAEPPSWVRVFIPEDWAAPDARELSMEGPAGATDPTWVDWHRWRRWMDAVNVWYDQHPERDFIDDLLERRQARRAAHGFQ
jgi:hypothetical protein